MLGRNSFLLGSSFDEFSLLALESTDRIFSLPGATLRLIYSLWRRKEDVRGRATGLFRTRLVARFLVVAEGPFSGEIGVGLVAAALRSDRP